MNRQTIVQAFIVWPAILAAFAALMVFVVPTGTGEPAQTPNVSELHRPWGTP